MRILDVGCSTGDLLALFWQKFHCEAFGLDPDADAISLARRLYPEINFFLGELESAPWEPNSFDVVISSATLEHVPDPLRFLHQQVALLRAGGVVLCMTPNIEATGFRILRAYWRDLLSPQEHIFLFSAQSAERLCAAAGLKFAAVFASHDPLIPFISLRKGLREQLEVRKRLKLVAYWTVTNVVKLVGRVLRLPKGGELLFFAARRPLLE